MTFSVSGCNCTIVAAEALYTAFSEGQVPDQCATTQIAVDGSSVTFLGGPQFDFWQTFRIWLNCS